MTTQIEDTSTGFPDYCRSCVEQCGCGRWDTLTEPDEIEWPGPGSTLTARYQCSGGHEWTCRWSPELLALHGGKGE